MKYWGWLLAKLSAALAFLYGMWTLLNLVMPAPQTFMRQRVSRFPQDFSWTTALLAFWLLSIGLFYLVLWDQRRRCRTCARRLRMPVSQGSWSNGSIFSPPRLESICPYGHGTQKVPELHLASSEKPTWQEHSDIWDELEQLSRK